MLARHRDHDCPYVEQWLTEFDRALGRNLLSAYRAILAALPPPRP
jgi:hypothetical protein